MPTNPNNAFKGRGETRMMTVAQRDIIERQCKEHNISLIALTTRALGGRKKTKELTHLDAARCMKMAGVWENYRSIGEEP